MKYYLYILKSTSSGKYYTGISQNPETRLNYYYNLEKGFTSRYRPWQTVVIKEYETKELAHMAEQKIKKWKSRIMIERIISGELNI